MVESDANLGEYSLFASHLDSPLYKCHASPPPSPLPLPFSLFFFFFFFETASHIWTTLLKKLQELSLTLKGVKKCGDRDYSQKLGAAVMIAHKVEQTIIQ